MTYHALHHRLKSDPALVKDLGLSDPLPALVALELLTPLTGVPLAALSLSPLELAKTFPQYEIPEAARPFFGGARQRYLAWHRCLFDALFVVGGHPVDGSEVDVLFRIARLEAMCDRLGVLRTVAQNLPTGMSLREMTREVAIAVDGVLDPGKRVQFRKGLSLLDRLRASKFVVGKGILSPEPIGPLPSPSDQVQVETLPPLLKAYLANRTRKDRFAVNVIYHIAVRGGLVDAVIDLAPADLVDRSLLARLLRLEPQDHGFPTLKTNTYRKQLKKLSDEWSPGAFEVLLHAFRREQDPAGAAWADLRAAMRDAGMPPAQIDPLSTLAAIASKAGFAPAQVTPTWISDVRKSLDRRKDVRFMAATRTLERLRTTGETDPSLLPSVAVGVPYLRIKGGKPKPTPTRKTDREAHPTAAEAWTYFFEDMHKSGIDRQCIDELKALRSHARRAGLAPSDVTREFLLEAHAQASESRLKLGRAAQHLDSLRSAPGLVEHMPRDPIGTLPDPRRSVPSLVGNIAKETEHVLAFRGLSGSGTRTTRVSVNAFAEAKRQLGVSYSTLADLLRDDFEGFDWPCPATAADRYIRALRGLRAFHLLPWTPAWTALHAAVVRAGVPNGDNPVAALLGYAEGRAPNELDLAWAQDIDRQLRRPNALSRHGRADLAITFTRNIERLDILHEVDSIKETGLLPRLFGPIR